MVTKLKNSKLIILSILLLIAMVFSLGFNLYNKKEDIPGKQQAIINSGVLYSIYPLRFSLYYDSLSEGGKKSEADVFINEEELYKRHEAEYYSALDHLKGTFEEGSEDYKKVLSNIQPIKDRVEMSKHILRSDMEKYKRDFYDDYENLAYYLENRDNGKVIEHSDYDLKDINKGNMDEKGIILYVTAVYDEHGNVKVESYPNVGETYLDNTYRNIGSLNDNEFNGIKNAKITFAIPKDLKYYDNIYNVAYDARYRFIEPQIAMAVAGILLVFLLISVFIPKKIAEKILLTNLIRKIPLEIGIIISISLIPIFLASGVGFFYELQGGQVLFFKGSDPSLFHRAGFIITQGLFYFISLLCFIGSIYYFKTLREGRLKDNLKNKSIIYRTIRWIGRKVKNSINRVRNVDLKDINTKMVVKYLGINFIILLGISILTVVITIPTIFLFGVNGEISILLCFIIGATLLLIYFIILFLQYDKKVKKTIEDYKRLHALTGEIAEGNLDFNEEENFGMFNSLGESLKDIKKGFKRAVIKEIKSERMKTELISNVSHDLKTPLTSIISYVDLLKNKDLEEEKRVEYLDILDKKSERLKELIEDLFEVSKATSGDIKLNVEKVDVVSLMKQALVELEDRINSANLKVVTNYSLEKAIVDLDPQRTFRVFENLLVNITKYSMEGSRVYIDIEENEEAIKITLKNISAHEITFTKEEIMERFQRGDKSRNTEGNGLGISIAKTFVEVQNGSFDINLDGDLFKVIIEFKK